MSKLPSNNAQPKAYKVVVFPYSFKKDKELPFLSKMIF